MGGHRVLIVEDSPAMRELVASALARIPDVEAWDEAADGGEALQKLAAQNYSAAIVDINLPVLDGLKLIEHIRNNPTTKNLGIVVMTTNIASSDRVRAMELGADAYLLKPIQAGEFVDALARAVQRPKT